MSNEQTGEIKKRAALIGGSGFSGALEVEMRQPAKERIVTTAYGEVTVQLYTMGDNEELVFIPRHGKGHSVAPHRINHPANLSALAALGVSGIVATSAVGSVKREISPGTMIVLDDFIDLRGGVTTLFEAPRRVRHADFSEPFSEQLRLFILEEAAILGTERTSAPLVYPAGVYLCVNGPRYETPAEIRAFATLGADVVGMTVAPEAILARELDLPYANAAIVTNLGTGLAQAALSHSEVESQMAVSRPFLLEVLLRTIRRMLAA
ncbi:MAG: MTAP family purine nucleoside phosphorylase [Capsulimonadaceae bacterium]|nr:MTAP family purine nucleoside phosphorylase [Capsulimonadaceae bacterium]